jgi:hypothetical protein
MTAPQHLYRIYITTSVSDRNRWEAHISQGDQVLERVGARSMATLMFHVRAVIADHTSGNKPQAKPVEAPTPKPKASKKPKAPAAPAVEEITTTETEVTE